jgi:hypothetical protein
MTGFATAAVCATLVDLALAQAVAPRGGAFVVVPHAAGDVYVPLDPSARPLFPAVPPAPRSPGTPASPAMPGSPEPGYLWVEIEPGAAQVYVDGAYASLARDLGPGRASLALRAGLRRIDVVLAGFRSLIVVAEIVAGEVRTLRGSLEGDPRSAGEPRFPAPSGGGYFVVPPATRDTAPPTTGGGYHVVPRP